jgi:hypothetical protein
MEAVDTGGPLRGWMPQQRGAIVFQIRRQLHPQWVLNLGRLEERSQQRGGRKVCDGKSLADEVRAVLPLMLNAVAAYESSEFPRPIPSQGFVGEVIMCVWEGD